MCGCNLECTTLGEDSDLYTNYTQTSAELFLINREPFE